MAQLFWINHNRSAELSTDRCGSDTIYQNRISVTIFSLDFDSILVLSKPNWLDYVKQIICYLNPFYIWFCRIKMDNFSTTELVGTGWKEISTDSCSLQSIYYKAQMTSSTKHTTEINLSWPDQAVAMWATLASVLRPAQTRLQQQWVTSHRIKFQTPTSEKMTGYSVTRIYA